MVGVEVGGQDKSAYSFMPVTILASSGWLIRWILPKLTMLQKSTKKKKKRAEHYSKAITIDKHLIFFLR